MTDRKQNCWEHMRCGRQPGGIHADTLGVCPAAEDATFDGINSGRNAGRICWAVAGTFCHNGKQGTFAEKRESCVQCDFFRTVLEERNGSNLLSEFLHFISESARDSFLNNLRYRRIKAGHRFLCQGDAIDEAYIIQKGSCLMVVEKNGELHPAGHRAPGDIVGLPAILTGEPHMAHAEAETDMELWVLKKHQFDNLSEANPELLRFLTELVVSRFDTRRPIAERAIGKYIIDDIIGRGTFSIVYKGIHSELNMPVAIKMMRHDLVLEPEFQKNFRFEAETIASMNHDNIVKVYDIEQRYRTNFIIMEYIEGESLKAMLDRLKSLPPMLTLKYLIQICSGLRYAHARRIVHRDVNPLNFLVLPNDRVKILDFGVACPAGTETLEFLGTMAYNSPEQIAGDPIDARADIYSLAIMTYEMLTGRRPFPEKSMAELMKAHRLHDVPDPAEVRPDIPEALRGFVLKAGKCDPDARYKDIDAAMADLNPLARHYGISLPFRPGASNRKMAVLHLFYDEDQQGHLNHLLEKFHNRVEDAGIDWRRVDFYQV